MKVKLWATIVAVLAIIGIGVWAGDRTIQAPGAVPTPAPAVAPGYENATYTIEHQKVTLVSGRSETSSAPGSASKTVTQYFGNEATGDLNGDGVPDAAFLLTQYGGGSGTFFYVVAAINTPTGYRGTNGILLGDRIAPQNTRIASGTIIVNYAERNPSEPMTTPPSIGVTKYFRVENGSLVEVKG